MRTTHRRALHMLYTFMWYDAGGVGSAENDQKSRVMGFHHGQPFTLAVLAFLMGCGGEKKDVQDSRMMQIYGSNLGVVDGVCGGELGFGRKYVKKRNRKT